MKMKFLSKVNLPYALSHKVSTIYYNILFGPKLFIVALLIVLKVKCWASNFLNVLNIYISSFIQKIIFTIMYWKKKVMLNIYFYLAWIWWIRKLHNPSFLMSSPMLQTLHRMLPLYASKLHCSRSKNQI